MLPVVHKMATDIRYSTACKAYLEVPLEMIIDTVPPTSDTSVKEQAKTPPSCVSMAPFVRENKAHRT